MNPIRISSNATLLIKLFFPTLWVTFFTLFLVAILVYSGESGNLYLSGMAKWILIIGYVFFIVLIYFTLFRIKRVEIDATHIYLSNYLKTYRYPLSDIKSVKYITHSIRPVCRLQLSAKGKFGKNIYFLLNPVQLEHSLKTISFTEEFSALLSPPKDK